MSNNTKTFDVYWSPEGKKIATVKAVNARAACRMAPMPYRKFLGEVYAKELNSILRSLCELPLVSQNQGKD